MDRTKAMHHYAIRGGKEGKERLDLLARVMLPTTSQLSARVGLSKGMKCFDVGCGGGHVTLLMAGIVGPEGRVTSTDTDGDILALARKDAEVAGLTNVEFRQMDACICLCREEFDLVYARFMLSHLSEPENCLATMLKTCRRGGTIVIEDTDFSGSFCYPTCAAYERYKELYQKGVQRSGGDPNIGPRLPELLRNAGVQAIELDVVQPTHIRGESKLMAPITMARISGALISEELATENEAQQIVAELKHAAADSDTVMSLPRIFQVWERRRGRSNKL
jgi:predicted O-methyltransferase YrrM